jgi:hypothetical protein
MIQPFFIIGRHRLPVIFFSTSLFISVDTVIGIQFFHALGTKTMAEFGFRVVADINLHLLPVPGVVPYLFAVCANRHYTTQGFNLAERPAQRIIIGDKRLLHLNHTPADIDAGAKFIGVKGLGYIVIGSGRKRGQVL